jgi:hypothetical protein
VVPNSRKAMQRSLSIFPQRIPLNISSPLLEALYNDCGVYQSINIEKGINKYVAHYAF